MLSFREVEKLLEGLTDEELCLIHSHSECKIRGLRAGFGHLPGDGFTGVYTMETEAGISKIGRTKNLRQRAVNLRGEITKRNYGKITGVHFISVENRIWHYEQDLMTRFQDKWVDGEYFRLSSDDLAYIKTLSVSYGGQA